MKDNKNKKLIYSFIIIAVLLITVVGVTYSFFNYTRTGNLNSIATGRIYFNSIQNGKLELTNVFPVKSTDLNENSLDAVEVNLIGDTTYTGGEEYLITLVDVQNTVNGKQIPINFIASYTANNEGSIGEASDDYWNERENMDSSIYLLTEEGIVEDGKQILVGYINDGQTGINGKLTIKAYLDTENIAISDTYPESLGYQLNKNMTEEESGLCLNYFANHGDLIFCKSGQCQEHILLFCNGEGTTLFPEEKSFQEMLDNNDFSSSDISYFLENNIITYNGNGTTDNWVNGRVVLTTEEWNSLQNTPISFKIRAESNEGIWVPDPNARPVNACFFDVSSVQVATYDINKEACVTAFEDPEMLGDFADAICSGQTVYIEEIDQYFNFDVIVPMTGMSYEQLQEQGIIRNVATGPANELKVGMTYVNGQYTYTYIPNGWSMTLTDKESTVPVTTTMCTTINNYYITSMYGVFKGSQATSLDLSSFNTSNVTNMQLMFYGSQATSLDLSSFNTSNVTSMSNMFYGSQATSLDLSNFDTSNVTNMAYMFYDSQATSIDLSSFDTSNVIDMGQMFYGSNVVNLDLSNFDTSSVTNMTEMFFGSQAKSLDLSSFDTSNVTSMSNMFYGSQATSLDLSSFDTSNVSLMYGMFDGSLAETIYVSNLWNINNVTIDDNMFAGAHVVGPNGTKVCSYFVENTCYLTGSPTDKTYARVDNAPDEPGYFTYKDAPNSKCYSKSGTNYWGDYAKDNTYSLVNNVSDKITCLS